jgi:fibrillarin-like pre-rRNA processing protein
MGQGKAVATLKEHPRFRGVYIIEDYEGKRLATENLVPGIKVYGEDLYHFDKTEYRIWNTFRSKLAASIEKGIKDVPVTIGSRMLYLGAASGTTASHVSDILGRRGRIFCVEFAPRVMRELIEISSPRGNMIPILGDARMPSSYRSLVEVVDSIYCDVAQPQQAKLLADNADMFLKKHGKVMIAIKARSVDVTKDPLDIFKHEINVLEGRGFKIIDVKKLEPFDKDHAMAVGELI